MAKQIPAPEGYVSMGEAAQLVGIAHGTMCQKVRRGIIPEEAVEVIGQQIFVLRSAVDDFASERQKDPYVRAKKWDISSSDLLEEFDHIASIVGPQQANSHLMKVYGIQEDTISNLMRGREYNERRRARRRAMREARQNAA